MKTKYIDLIDQTFDFPQKEFFLEDDHLIFHGIDLMKLVEKYGTPLKFNYLPQVSNNIERCKGWFRDAMNAIGYTGTYNYSYCTKISHFAFVMDEVLKNNVNLETSSSYDLDIIEHLLNEGKISPEQTIICNGFKQDRYVEKIAELLDRKAVKVIPVVVIAV